MILGHRDRAEAEEVPVIAPLGPELVRKLALDSLDFVRGQVQFLVVEVRDAAISVLREVTHDLRLAWKQSIEMDRFRSRAGRKSGARHRRKV